MQRLPARNSFRSYRFTTRACAFRRHRLGAGSPKLNIGTSAAPEPRGSGRCRCHGVDRGHQGTVLRLVAGSPVASRYCAPGSGCDSGDGARGGGSCCGRGLPSGHGILIVA